MYRRPSSVETSPITLQRPPGARPGRVGFRGEEAKTVEPAANPEKARPPAVRRPSTAASSFSRYRSRADAEESVTVGTPSRSRRRVLPTPQPTPRLRHDLATPKPPGTNVDDDDRAVGPESERELASRVQRSPRSPERRIYEPLPRSPPFGHPALTQCTERSDCHRRTPSVYPKPTGVIGRWAIKKA
jgi:hypothetical protein